MSAGFGQMSLDELAKVVPPPLPLVVSPTPHPTGTGTIQDQFQQFHRQNPWVYEHLVRLTRELVRKGQRKVGMGMLFEVMRWQVMMTTADPNSEFKLNNNYRSRYARMIMLNHPDLHGIYEIRKLQSA